MDRLTERDEFGNADIIGVDGSDLQINLEFDELNRVTGALNRLAAYEDTGLSPKEVGDLHYDHVVFRETLAENARLKAERDAAVEDMKIMALAMRESDELMEGCCFACICENLPADCILPYGECPGYNTNDCFEWRGLEGRA